MFSVAFSEDIQKPKPHYCDQCFSNRKILIFGKESEARKFGEESLYFGLFFVENCEIDLLYTFGKTFETKIEKYNKKTKEDKLR